MRVPFLWGTGGAVTSAVHPPQSWFPLRVNGSYKSFTIMLTAKDACTNMSTVGDDVYVLHVDGDDNKSGKKLHFAPCSAPR